ncbi:molybdopterin converting factor subunit 1 [Robertmurraya yapensis]|uniref:Molybdopterin synthase sulfur carrier subunit n=1 Tax=Bacillus yapensis TaxID=2492960 RepID=A0A3S0IDI9_9BACI|nr:molybdopterin converting factor subunit 1 [Bacillus yapensis]RTR33055.1 molybdopterin converting factor subunit 1 [Bacillus yapensis]TKS96878.1 molybdopterin converting factor subunit 1 [Bacillus yapensis]
MNKILFFAHLKDAVGEESIRIDLAGKTVAEVKEFLAKEYQLQKLDTAMTAVNEEFAGDDEVIHPGDEIAFIPPVSGG